MSLLLIVRGKVTEFDVSVLDGDGNPLDLDTPINIVLRFMAKHSFADANGSAVIDLSTPADIVKADQSTNPGEATIRVPSSATAGLPNTGNTRLVWECQATQGSERWVVDAGVAIVTREVILPS
jgi:hypothetical protein